MFANRTVNPSPNRTSIKEANDHLQLLHERVIELENTTQEQADALKMKDEFLQQTVRELTQLKNSEIEDLVSVVTQLKERVNKLEHLLQEKDQQIEHLSHKCSLADDVASFTPAVEKLLGAMRKLPYKPPKHTPSKSKPRVSRSQNTKPERRSITSMDSSHSHYAVNSVDGHVPVPSQSFADLNIARSFNINSNFSLSEDDQQSEIL